LLSFKAEVFPVERLEGTLLVMLLIGEAGGDAGKELGSGLEI
jgi:hypothetical protein